MKYRYFGVLIFFLLFPASVSAQLVLPKLISDGMVLQRDSDVKIWGWSDPGEKIRVTFLDSQFTTTAGESGLWAVFLPPANAGGPHTMTIEAGNGSRHIIENILMGEVWVASGQSNMELSMQRVSPLYRDEIAGAEFPFIRYFEVPKRYNFNNPEEDLPSGSWVSVEPSSINQISAVSYFYARHLHQKLDVPVGIINSALGGSPAEAWMSKDALKSFPEHYEEAIRFRDDELIRQIERADQQRISLWYTSSTNSDAGHRDNEPWYADGTDTPDWNSMNIPGYWSDEETGPVNGVVWFRREIQVPESMALKPAKLEMGRIVDADSTFVNGVFVGNTTYQYPPRWYHIPENVLKPGRNTITVRVISERGRGGFIPDKPYELTVGADTVDLKGGWKYKIGSKMEPLESQTFIRWKPMGLYNAMISPLTNYRIRGAIWYQGESNVGRPQEYRKLFATMIEDWQNSWGQEDFPFIFVQLANYLEASDEPADSEWARLREAQLKTLSMPNTGMATAIDIGEWNDIHPLNKKDVGDRLARTARHLAYSEDLVYSGPLYQSMSVEGGKIRITFNHTGSGLTAVGDDNLNHFAVAGKDRKFVWAKARIEGSDVVVWSDDIDDPVSVRYAWADNPETANLYNREGLPASPFRTDDW